MSASLTKKQRESNFEALRIVAMLMIIFHHTMLLGPHLLGYGDRPYSLQEQGVLPVALNSVMVYSVNLFVMISGWFGIHGMVKAALRVLIDTAVYGAVACVAVMCLVTHDFEWGALLPAIEIHKWWFVYAYLFLVLFSPLLESALRPVPGATPRGRIGQAARMAAALAVVNVFFGWYANLTLMDGYNVYVFHFLFLYCMARLMRMCVEVGYRVRRRWLLLVLAVSCSIITAGYVRDFGYRTTSVPALVLIGWFAHNHPLGILNTLCIVGIFAQTRLRSAFVNKLAGTVFGVYLLHASPYGTRPLRALSEYMWGRLGYGGLLLATLATFAVCAAVAYAIERAKARPIKCLFYVIDATTARLAAVFTRLR